MEHLIIHQYVHNVLKTFFQGHPTAFVYHFIGDDVKEKDKLLQLLFPGLVLCIEINLMLRIFSMD